MILDDLVQVTSKRIEKEKQEISLAKIKELALSIPNSDPENVYNAFLTPGIHIIGEVKKASPSKGLIDKNFPYLQIAKEYDQAGATAISVLTEPDYFQGKLSYLAQISKNVETPVLRKDFTIDSYMIYQAKVAGAKIILLIVAILTEQKLKDYLSLAHRLGLAVIVEAHDADEVRTAINAGAKMIGVNNRNLKNFTVSFENCINLRPLVPKSIAFIAESGVKTVSDVHELAKIGANGVLIGETLMRSDDKSKFIKSAVGDEVYD